LKEGQWLLPGFVAVELFVLQGAEPALAHAVGAGSNAGSGTAAGGDAVRAEALAG
jgi:hypothetical protein